MAISVKALVVFVALMAIKNDAAVTDNVNYDLSMVVNMLNHHDVKIQKLEKGLSSITTEIQKMNQMIKDGFKTMNQK